MKHLLDKTFVMLDVETLSTRSNAKILSIGALAFTIPVGGEDLTFYKRIDPNSYKPNDFHSSQETLDWWNTQPEEVRQEAFGGHLYILDVLFDFYDWFPKDAIVISNGADFDIPIVQTAYEIYYTKAPWNYRNKLCYRTLKNLFPEVEVPTVQGVTKHNAIDDCIIQTSHFRAIINHLLLKGN